MAGLHQDCYSTLVYQVHLRRECDGIDKSDSSKLSTHWFSVVSEGGTDVVKTKQTQVARAGKPDELFS